MKLVIRPSEIQEATGYHKNSIFRLEKEGKFPKRRQLGQLAVGWLTSEVESWLASRPIVDGSNATPVNTDIKLRGRPTREEAAAKKARAEAAAKAKEAAAA